MSLADLAEFADFIFLIFLPHLNLIAKAIGFRGGQILLFPLFLREINYSFFNASAGLVLAALNVCHNTDRKAISTPRTTATAIIQP